MSKKTTQSKPKDEEIEELDPVSTLGDLFEKSDNEIDGQARIINELISDNDLEKKTDLSKPILWSTLDVLKDKMEQKHFTFSVSIINRFMNQSFRYLISKERKSRQELVEALKSLSMSMNTTNENSKIKELMK